MPAADSSLVDLARREIGSAPVDIMLAMTVEQLASLEASLKRARRRAIGFSLNGRTFLVARSKALRYASLVLHVKRVA